MAKPRTTLEVPRHEVAYEVSRQWARRKKPPKALSVEGPPGRQLIAHLNVTTPLLIENPVSASRIDGELAQRIALDVVAVYVTLRGQIATFLRPVVGTDLPFPLGEQDLLDCSGPSFRKARRQAIREIVRGERERVLLVFEDAVFACMTSLPPLDLGNVHAVAAQEIEFLRSIRWSGIPPDRLLPIFRAWVDQFTSMNPAEEPVTRVITGDEGNLLDLYGRAGSAARERAVKALRGDKP